MKEKEEKQLKEVNKKEELSEEALKRLTEYSIRISDLILGGDVNDVQ